LGKLVDIRAVSVYGSAVGSGSIALTDSVAPAVPTGLEGTWNSGKLYLSWNANGEIDLGGYRVHYDWDEGGEPYDGTASIYGKNSPITVGADTSIVVTGLANKSVYYVALTAYDVGQNQSGYSDELVVEAVSVRSPSVPDKHSFSLFQSYPNPFNPQTTIVFEMPEPGDVSLKVFNAAGQIVATLVEEHKPTGRHIVHWDGRNQFGRHVSSGVYFYRLQAGDYVETKRMILLK
jgi:hypothetical protein